VRNISERKQAEQLYHNLADSSPVGVYIIQNSGLFLPILSFNKFPVIPVMNC